MQCQLIVLVLVLTVAVSAEIQVRKISKRIIGGKSTDIRAVPYQVSVQKNHWHTCGGSIIYPSWILTAGHCVHTGTAKNYSVRAGSIKHYSGGVVVQVSSIIKHPYFRVNASKYYDVALLQLETTLKTDSSIKPIPLAESEPQEGDKIVVSGWGSFKEEGPYSAVLQATVLPVVSKEKCNEVYKRIRPISEIMFCAGFAFGGADACKGDSGGPAVFNKKLVGIVSWGMGCARKNIPGVYVNVAAIRSWIESMIT